MPKAYLVIILLLIYIFAMCFRDVEAGEYNALIGSYHSPQSDHCEFNPGLGYTWDNRVGAMLYSNSHCDTSFLVSYSMPMTKNLYFQYGGALGYDNPVQPFVSFSATFGKFFVGFVPTMLVDKDRNYIIYYGVNF